MSSRRLGQNQARGREVISVVFSLVKMLRAWRQHIRHRHVVRVRHVWVRQVCVLGPVVEGRLGLWRTLDLTFVPAFILIFLLLVLVDDDGFRLLLVAPRRLRRILARLVVRRAFCASGSLLGALETLVKEFTRWRRCLP